MVPVYGSYLIETYKVIPKKELLRGLWVVGCGFSLLSSLRSRVHGFRVDEGLGFRF